MSTKNLFNFLATAMIVCCATCMITSCQGFIDAVVGNVDNPAPTTQPTNDAAQLKQGIWTEYDEALLNSGKYTAEQLAQMPTVGMWLQGDKGYFFTYTAEDMSETVEGQINYNKSTNTGTITFPWISGSPLSIQTVNFSMASDDVMEFEYTYEGKKITGHCAWLCENLDNWSSDITDADWLELMAYYEGIKAKGPDASIDWSDSSVEGLDEPLVWDDEVASTRANTRAIFSAITTGLEIFGSLFEEDPNEEINAKLDAVLGKLDNVLQNQQVMNAKLDMINQRLIDIAQKMKKTEIVNIFNNRNEKFYNRLKVQNTKYFEDAYKAYKANKNDPELANYAKAWVGKDEQYANLTWEYIEYLTTVEHTDFGKGMDRIYDGLVFNKYPWEHIGVGDRKNYRAYDLTMIAKSLFMISLYSTYGGLNNIEQKGLYNSYKDYKPKLKAFSEFKISDPDKFRVCQIKDAHFIMHKEIQKYNYHKYGDSKAPNYKVLDYFEIVFRPEWHEAGSIKIENPKELKSKLIYDVEMKTLYNYYKSAFYSNQDKIWWTKMLVGDDASKQPGGAVLAKPLASPNNTPDLVIVNRDRMWYAGTHEMGESGALDISPVWADYGKQITEVLGQTKFSNNTCQWASYNSQYEYYMAIIEKRY